MNKLVFDPKLWANQDVEDNSQFWKEAEILWTYTDFENEEIAVVRFVHDGRESRGHFVSAMRDVL